MATNQPLHVIVAGGGIGGLALANGLHRAGVSVSVHEREVERTDRLQGFRIHIDPHGSTALAELLSPRLYSFFAACAGKGGNGFGFITDQMKQILQFDPREQPFDPAGGGHYGISRITLRRILLAELHDTVRFGSVFDHYERRADGRVVAHFADGATEVGDVLVGADGGTSRVRAQYLPHAERIDTGIVTIAGKYALTEQARDRLPPLLLANPLTVIPPRGCGMFLAPHEFTLPTDATNVLGGEDRPVPESLFDDTQPYVFWAFGAKRERYDTDPETLSTTDLHQLAVRMTTGWAPELRTLVNDSDPETATAIPIKTSVPIPAWESTNVTLLGDAIHSMTPYGGIGANTALRDARLLCRNLIAAENRKRGLLESIHTYEAEMTDYGFAAVRHSLTVAEQSVSDNPIARTAGKLAFRAARAIPALQRKMFADILS
ncbi:FAD-dependent monooxygenase [Nocardia sp. NBC_01377]|uniref:FAD-dependent oxidoreductase n=1 Tax=Nocardia sp. NBC_01377 TaxID=2903595 RepID=UPI0032477B67